MVAKTFLVVCLQVLFAEIIISQSIGNVYNPAILNQGVITELPLVGNLPFMPNDLIAPNVASELAYAKMAAPIINYARAPVAVNGGGFPVTCTSPITPIGISVVSENAIDGIVSVKGELPVLSAVALKGQLPTSGSGTISYGCGNGEVGITSESLAPERAYGARIANERMISRDW